MRRRAPITRHRATSLRRRSSNSNSSSQRQILATTQANTEQRTANTINGMAPATTVVTKGGALELRSQSSDLMPSLFKHQMGRRNNDGTNRADRKAVTAIRCGLVMSN